MKIRTWLTPALILTLGGVAAAVQAQSAAPKIKFAEMDADKDGRITRKEWRGNEVSFAQQDTNSDGVLSGAEVAIPSGGAGAAAGGAGSAARPDRRDSARLERLFQRMDTNKDGRLSHQEWQSDKFDRLDSNHDKFVSRAEFVKR